MFSLVKKDPIEKRFRINRHPGGHHSALDVSTFLCNERALLLHLIGELCANSDGSHNKTLHKSFFIVVNSMIETSERIEIYKLKDKWMSLKQIYVDGKK